MAKRRFERGEPILTFEDLMNQTWVFVKMFKGPRHMGFIMSLQLRVVKNWLDQGRLLYAVENEQEE